MARTGPSEADAALLDHLRGKGRQVSLAQLERWRLAGILPRNERKPLGRGRGSTSTLHPASADIAEAIAMTSRRSRSIYEAALRVFAADPRHDDLFVLPGVQLPEQAIRSALDWFVDYGDQSLDRRIERLIKRTSASSDEKSEMIYRLAMTHYRRVRNNPQPTPERFPNPWSLNDDLEIRSFALLAVAKFIGQEEVGPESYAEIITNSRILKKKSPKDAERIKHTLESLLIQRQLSEGRIVPTSSDPDSEQVREQLSGVSISRMRETRDKLAFASEAGRLFSCLLGSEIGEPLTTRIHEASTSSIDANMLLHAIIPIAENIPGGGWYQMTGMLITILTQPPEDFIDEGYAIALDRLAHAAAPDRFDEIP
ncbi:hypothetical protein ACIRQT_11655 [Streptomyces californicus]|uniref:hypothetical protein n=1 Tax=Streptomyces californicus TaxID=67351 RepID=UPI00380C1282